MSFKIVYDKNSCIGAGTCSTISKQLWHVDGDKATLKGATLNPKTGAYELVLDDANIKQEQAVVGSCPAGCIKIEKM